MDFGTLDGVCPVFSSGLNALDYQLIQKVDGKFYEGIRNLLTGTKGLMAMPEFEEYLDSKRAPWWG